jgi:hypothetical protein
MKSSIVLLVLLSGLFGRAPGNHWAKSGATQEEVVRDRYACAREARQRGALEDGGADRRRFEEVYDRCLGRRGYEKVAHP